MIRQFMKLERQVEMIRRRLEAWGPLWMPAAQAPPGQMNASAHTWSPGKRRKMISEACRQLVRSAPSVRLFRLALARQFRLVLALARFLTSRPCDRRANV
eukprot:SAG11_NODE_2927_length_2832_cov_2.358946_2_plen_100_part_00